MKTDGLFEALYQLADFPDSLRPNRARGREFRARVDKLVVFNTFPSEQILLTEGQREETMYFLDSGFARGFSYDTDNGKEDTRFLWKASSFVAAPQSFYQRQLSDIYIQVCGGAKMISATFRDMTETFADFPEGVLLTRSVSLQFVQAQDWRSHMLTKMNPRQKYEALLKEFPGVMQHFAADIIASYLSIAPETLSRVRKLIS